MRSAPARSVSVTCSPKRAKSAARIDGASLTTWFCIFALANVRSVNCSRNACNGVGADRLTMEQSQARADDLLHGIYDGPQNLVGHNFIGVSVQAFSERFP